MIASRRAVATANELTEPVDVALANVLPSLHGEIAADVRRLTANLVIVAGLLDAQAADIESAYGGRCVGVLREEGWAALALRVDPVEARAVASPCARHVWGIS